MAGSFDVDHGALALAVAQGGPFESLTGGPWPGCAPLERFHRYASLPWITSRFINGSPVWVARPDDLPVQAERDRTFLERVGIRSIASLPLVIDWAPVGWLMLGTASNTY